MVRHVDIAVIGGGAAGLCAAVTAAEHGAKVALLEASCKVGSKILATGNGRCNLTNMGVSCEFYNKPSFVGPVLSRFGASQIRDWFAARGLLTVEEREGRVYPYSYSANSVLDVLRAACERARVSIACDKRVIKICAAPPAPFTLACDDGMKLKAGAVIAAGGGGSDILASCGHAMTPLQPVLCALETDAKPIRGLNGVRVRACLSVVEEPETVFREEGEVLFRDYGISGVVVFNASRFAASSSTVAIDFMPHMGKDEFQTLLAARCAYAADYQELLLGIFHPQVNRALLRAAGCKLSAVPDDPGIARLAQVIKRFSLKCKGPANAKNAQVTRGGADVNEFCPETLESKLVPGLYAAGECFDIDAACGGFNLHWAWSSGIVAAEHAAVSILRA